MRNGGWVFLVQVLSSSLCCVSPLRGGDCYYFNRAHALKVMMLTDDSFPMFVKSGKVLGNFQCDDLSPIAVYVDRSDSK